MSAAAGWVTPPTTDSVRRFFGALVDGLSYESAPEVFLALVLWQLLLLYTVPVGFWNYEMAVLVWRRWTRRNEVTLDVEWGLDAVQARIVTIDNEAITQQTVDSLPAALTDVVVIAEVPIEVTGADVLVVPPEFSCVATHKGRAVEWARRAHPTTKEYVLYLDEDTDASALTCIPSNADIVQFRERPTRTGGIVPFMAEIHRIGFNVEQRTFPFLRVPFYAWGGGIAIRRSLEERVTWDTSTIVEDSVFTWRAVLEFDATVDVADVYLENQAPPTVRAMVSQRRRWLTGARQRTDLLPTNYRLLYEARDLGWALSTFGPLLWIVSFLSAHGTLQVSLLPVFLPNVYLGISFTLLAYVYGWSLFGLLTYRPHPAVWVFLLAFTPLVVALHSLGALYGIVRPAQTFQVTRKVIEETVEEAIEETVETVVDGEFTPAVVQRVAKIPADDHPNDGSRPDPEEGL